ncbi:hypothetical protein HY844_00030 [Candidatus Berkelbacteria bacterium]|nr:hypothetical protein [Candidatus Berkelbacteria bacterium]
MKDVVTAIAEPIKVVASFSSSSIRIHFFNWNDRIYKVDSVNLFHISQDGNTKSYHFSVSVGANSYELLFDPTTLSWRLENVAQI